MSMCPRYGLYSSFAGGSDSPHKDGFRKDDCMTETEDISDTKKGIETLSNGYLLIISNATPGDNKIPIQSAARKEIISFAGGSVISKTMMSEVTLNTEKMYENNSYILWIFIVFFVPLHCQKY